MKIEVRNGSFAYRKEQQILRNISFGVERGEILSILGSNGAGKTTLLKCMLGLLKWDSGETYLDGAPLSSIPYRSFWKKVSYVPQIHSTSFPCTAEETVLMGRSPYLGLFSSPTKKDEELALSAMEMCGILDLKNTNINELSGGQAQLVSIARALCAEPQILVLDEAETGLDYANQQIILNLLRKLSKQQGMTVIFNTHYPDHAFEISDRSLLLLKDGSILSGKSEEILSEENLQKTFGIEIRIVKSKIEGKDRYSLIPVIKEEN